MVNGIGPMQQVRDNLAFAAFYNEVTTIEHFKDPDSDIMHKLEVSNKGAIVFATNKNLGIFNDFQRPKIQIDDVRIKNTPLPDINPISVDFAPYLSAVQLARDRLDG